jgi:hypothetical protein
VTCKHNHYRKNQYCTLENAYIGMRQNKVAWIGMRVKNCKDCGADLSEYKIVPYKSPEQYLAEIGK